ncbi:MAG TPA: N-acetylmuramoyl-L-alanine amidase, partial [Verrucomicrobiae bacterium]
GKDAGFHDGRQQEKSYTLLLARELSNQLAKAGFKVRLTRSADEFIDLPVRPEKARKGNADLFISLHLNSAGNGAGAAVVKGSEVYCMTPAHTSSTNSRGEGASTGPYPGNKFDNKNVLLGYHIQKSLIRSLAVDDRGVRHARYAVLRTAEMPAVLIEGGYMSNPAEARKLYDANYRRQMARAITDGVLNYKKAVETFN